MSKVVIITGGSRGIGAACALKFAKLGFNILVNYKSNKTAADKVVQLVEAIGQKALAIQGDISDPASVNQLFLASESLGEVTVLVNNAGILETQSDFVDIGFDRIKRIFATNVYGTMLCSQAAIVRMSTENGGQGGVIINISSGAALTGSPSEYVDYAASKGAVDSFTIGLAAEVAKYGIRVNGVRPGLIYTEMHASGGEPNRVERLRHNLPLGRGGQPEEVAAAVVFLASDESAYTTGTFLNVTGGR